MAVDKNKAMIAYLLNCDVINDHPLFFNFINVKNDNNQILTQSSDTALHIPYVDGSVSKAYTITILLFKSISQNAVVKIEGYDDENVDDFAAVQQLSDWINEQNQSHIYPDFGDKCIVDSIELLSDIPVLDGIDDSVNPPLAQYSIQIRVQYLDTTNVIWNA